MSIISSHADYQYQDYRFERTQSRALQTLTWENTAPPLPSWFSSVSMALLAASSCAAFLDILR